MTIILVINVFSCIKTYPIVLQWYAYKGYIEIKILKTYCKGLCVKDLYFFVMLEKISFHELLTISPICLPGVGIEPSCSLQKKTDFWLPMGFNWYYIECKSTFYIQTQLRSRESCTSQKGNQRKWFRKVPTL